MGDRKVFLLGLDGLPPRFFQRFLAEGRMPRFARLAQRAAVLDVVPAFPPLTAPGWMVIASGANPSTIGVENILVSPPDAPIDQIANGFDRARSRAEYLWETLDRNGLPAIVLHYPGSWPPGPGNFVQVDGAGGYADIGCRFAAAPSRAFVTDAEAVRAAAPELIFPANYDDHWRIHADAGGRETVIAREPAGWRGLPADLEPVFEVTLHLHEHGRRAARTLFGLCARGAAGALLLLSPNKDVAGAGALRLRPGGWSDWQYQAGADGRYAYRFKLLALDLEARRLHVYQSEGHRLDGFTRPDDLAQELLRRVGPVAEWAGTFDYFNGLVDLETQLEIYAQHTDWMAATIRELGARQAWRGFFTHWHLIEYAHHLVGGSIHPDHPLHRPELAARDLDFLGRVYALADRLLEAVEDVIDDDTLLLVASDHGHDLLHSVFYANEFLRRHGWVATARGPRGAAAVDRAKTSAYALFPGCIHLNRSGRPDGIVAPEDADALCARIGEALKALVDPRTGLHPIKLVLQRDELAAYGLAGPQAPDLAFCMERGYEVATRIRAGAETLPEFELTEPGETATSGHGSFFPAGSSARTLAILAGPGVEPRSGERYPTPIVDLAPTLTAFLGIAPPRDCEGHAVPLNRPGVVAV